MSKSKRALQALDMIIWSLRKGYFPFTSTEREIMADDLAPARDYYARISVRPETPKDTKRDQIKAVMQEDMKRR